MKKIITAALMLCAAVSVHADLALVWNAPEWDTSALSWWGRVQTVGTATDKGGTSLGEPSYAKIGYFTENHAVGEYQAFVDNDNWVVDFDNRSAATVSRYADSSDSVNSDSFALMTGDNYYYYIAVFNSSDTLVAYSSTFQQSDADVKRYIWNDEDVTYPSGAFMGSGYAVPEPTSGLLVLLGMAGLALRRKKNA